MTKKKLNMMVEFSSIFHDPQWTEQIVISNFASNRTEDNRKFLESVKELCKEYNRT